MSRGPRAWPDRVLEILAVSRLLGMQVPEGRNNIAHRFNGGNWTANKASPVGATQG